ncbi:hypothetical protein AB1N83_002775 [Pleurotus pulmonarius]
MMRRPRRYFSRPQDIPSVFRSDDNGRKYPRQLSLPPSFFERGELYPQDIPAVFLTSSRATLTAQTTGHVQQSHQVSSTIPSSTIPKISLLSS